MLSIFRKAYDWINPAEPPPIDEKVAFKVMLDSESLEVGTLRAENGEWVFAYSDEFRKRRDVKPIIDFPFTDREYRSRILWPFFVLRIPSTQQPAVREFIAKQPDGKADQAQLLREFGERSIANPFRLVPV